MGNQKLRRGLSIALACSMLVSTCVWNDAATADAAAKAKLKTKKITLKVGQKKKITIKKKKAKAKYTFVSSRKGIAKVSKKGVVTAKKKGFAKITVKEKLGKKVRKLGKEKVYVKAKKVVTQETNSPATTVAPAGTKAPVASGAPTGTKVPAPNTAAPVTTASVTTAPVTSPAADTTKTPATMEPTAAPTEDPYKDLEWEKIDLSTACFGTSINYVYDTNTGIFNAKKQDYFGFPLAQELQEGQHVVVHVKGTNAGDKGFRSWLVDGNTGTCCANDGYYIFTEDGTNKEDFVVGDFDITYKLVASDSCGYLFFKAPSWDALIQDLSISSIEVSYSDKVERVDFELTEEKNKKMISDSLLSTGNNAKIKAVIEKARAGEDVTMAYIGGSVTEGSGANPNSNCYAELSCTEFGKKYGVNEGENVHFVNGGMSGTPSSLGIVRYDKDVLGQMAAGTTPDVLFVEFAVNDSGECTNGGAYEGLIRRALASGSAVILMYSVFRDNWNMQDTYIPYGEHYDLPMVSMKDAVNTYIEDAEGFRRWYFADAYHPTNAGHKLTADCIMNLFDTIDAEDPEVDNITDVASFDVYKTDAFTNTTLMGPTTIEDLLTQANSSLTAFNAGGFSSTDTETGKFLYGDKGEKFPTNWMHTAESGAESMTATVNCKNLLVVYKLSSSDKTGAAELWVDGVKKVTMNGHNKDGWNNATTALAFSEEEAAEHTIEIKMAEGSEEKEFTLLALGYN